MEQLQRKMIAQGALLFIAGLVAGFPFAFLILGKIALWPIPGSVEVSLPGDLRGWRMAHLEGILNGMMLFSVAAVLPRLTLSERQQRGIAWALIVTGWGNMLASAIGPMFGGRGLEFGGGWSNSLMYVLFMIAVFAVIYAMALVYRGATRQSLASLLALVIVGSLSWTGCSDDDHDSAFNPYSGFESTRYADPSMWLCRPDLPNDECRKVDLTSTRIEPAGGAIAEPHQIASAPDFDCFYVYPTVDLSSPPGNHTDFSDIRPILDPLVSQAARFTSLCRVFAPLYRQVSISTYSAPDNQQYFDVAYSDVEEAFRHYMGQYNQGRRVVIMGHSQGTHMTTRLLQNEFDAVPGLLPRLIVALMIGGNVTVPEGKLVGGSFQNLPLCTSDAETGCVIAYRTYAKGYPPESGSNVSGPEGFDTACTNPTALGGGKAVLSAAYLPTALYQPLFNARDPNIDVPTLDNPFVLYRNFYSAECRKDDRGRSYLEISLERQAGDARQDPILYTHPAVLPSFLGTHILDFNYTLGNLLDLVEAKATAARDG